MTELSIAKYSLEEVSRRDGTNGSRIWIIIKDKVIDVTDQLDQHPGGREVIMEYAGKDATKAFNNVGHSSEAHAYMKGAMIGELIEADKSANKGKKDSKISQSEKNSRKRIIGKSERLHSGNSNIFDTQVAGMQAFLLSYLTALNKT